jgi:hypothetical protein
MSKAETTPYVAKATLTAELPLIVTVIRSCATSMSAVISRSDMSHPLLLGLRLHGGSAIDSDQLGPDQVPVRRAQVPAAHRALGGGFDTHTFGRPERAALVRERLVKGCGVHASYRCQTPQLVTGRKISHARIIAKRKRLCKRFARRHFVE